MKGDPVPDGDHVVRYVGGTHIDGGIIHGGAFLAHRTERSPSVNWLECFSGILDEQVEEVRRRTRLHYGATAQLARLQVGVVRAYVAKNGPNGHSIDIVQDPLAADAAMALLADPSQAVMEGVPSADHPEGEMIGDLIAHCIKDVFPARSLIP
jgi:hypothetical protein